MMYRQEIYADDEGRAIHAKVPEGVGATEYLGIGNVDDGRGTLVQFEFLIHGDTIGEAFANHDEAFAPAQADCVRQIEEKQRNDRRAKAPKVLRAAANGVVLRP